MLGGPRDRMIRPRVALAHDYLNQYGGAERVVEAFHRVYPEAPVYTSIYDPERMPGHYRDWDVRTTFLQRAPGIHRHHQPYLPIYPLAFKFLRVDEEFDVVLSSSSAFGKGVSVPPGAMHICYCHSPMRFAWDFESYAERERINPLARRLLPSILGWLRNWDRATASRVHHIIANSANVAQRINDYWGREATVINPPVDTGQVAPVPHDDIGDYYLIISRLVPYKRFDIAIAAFNELGLPLTIIGDGRARAELERMSAPNVRFVGAVSEHEKLRLFAHCRAAIFPAEDDFGIAQVEVQAAGRPVIALARGGALDTVIDGVTGVLFSPQSVDGIIAAVQRFQHITFSTDAILRHARRFDSARFEREIEQFVSDSYAEFVQGSKLPRDESRQLPTGSRQSWN
jgi:glycosyltransferase involved in cell wall biosynthesis